MKDYKKYDTKQRLTTTKKKPTEEEIKKFKKFLDDNFKDMFGVFDDVQKEIVLLLKISDFLRSIDCRIGNPINNYNVMVRIFN